MNEDSRISGPQLGEDNVRVLAFADDVIFVCSSQPQVEAVLQIVGCFCAASGAEINPQKSVGMWLGGWATTPKKFGGIKWTTSLGSYLGVPIDSQENMTAVWKRTTNSVAAKLSQQSNHATLLWWQLVATTCGGTGPS